MYLNTKTVIGFIDWWLFLFIGGLVRELFI